MQSSPYSCTLHPDLKDAIEWAYGLSGLVCKNLSQEPESQGYGAFTFEINDIPIKFRVGKITLTKIGQFVTLWKRMGGGPIQPHDHSDPFDFFIVSVRNSKRFGQFVFPKALLIKKGIVSKEGKGGKLGIRIYPPWDLTKSPQAKKTQQWQLAHFFEIYPNESIDAYLVQKLFLI